MSIKHSAPILAMVFLALAIGSRSATTTFQPTNNSTETVQTADANPCSSKRLAIGTAIQQLRSGDYSQTGEARNSLFQIARLSNACKQLAVRELMEGMDQPDLDFERQVENYNLWREGSEILGQLRATEALDLLISHLALTNGFHSNSMVFQPAILGVRQMGDAAIPKVKIALQQNSNPRVRIAAAYCLTEIGGPVAMDALRQAQESEPSSCVANFIGISLSTFTYNSKNGISFDNSAPQATPTARQTWLAAFRCEGGL